MLLITYPRKYDRLEEALQKEGVSSLRFMTEDNPSEVINWVTKTDSNFLFLELHQFKLQVLSDSYHDGVPTQHKTLRDAYFSGFKMVHAKPSSFLLHDQQALIEATLRSVEIRSIETRAILTAHEQGMIIVWDPLHTSIHFFNHDDHRPISVTLDVSGSRIFKKED